MDETLRSKDAERPNGGENETLAYAAYGGSRQVQGARGLDVQGRGKALRNTGMTKAGVAGLGPDKTL